MGRVGEGIVGRKGRGRESGVVGMGGRMTSVIKCLALGY